MEHAVLVLEEREDREQARAAERRHPEILRLEREGQTNPLVAEEGTEFGVEAAPGLEQRHQLDQVGVREIPPRLERLLEERREAVELLAVRLHKPRERAAVGGREPGHLGLHPADVRGGQQFAPGPEHEPVLRVEPDHLDFLPKVAAAGREDLLQHPRVEEEGGPEVELEPLGRRDRAGPTSGHGQPFQHAHPHAGIGQEHGTGESAWSGSDDVDRPRHPQRSAAGAAPDTHGGR